MLSILFTLQRRCIACWLLHPILCPRALQLLIAIPHTATRTELILLTSWPAGPYPMAALQYHQVGLLPQLSSTVCKCYDGYSTIPLAGLPALPISVLPLSISLRSGCTKAFSTSSRVSVAIPCLCTHVWTAYCLHIYTHTHIITHLLSHTHQLTWWLPWDGS